MKTKLSLTIACIFLSAGIILRAQTPFYSFSQYTSAYSDLTSPTSLNNGNLWDFSIPTAYYQLNISSLLPFFLIFGDYNWDLRVYGGMAKFYHSTAQQDYYMWGFGFFSPDGMKDKGISISLSPISYQVTGSSPNRILKIEWKNAGHVAASADYLNVQIWLYETTHVIEVHYGSSSITNASTTQLGIGVGHTYVPTQNLIEDDFLENGPSNPVLSMSANAFYGIPANGTVYKFTPSGAGVNELNSPLSAIAVYPNPAIKGKMIIDSKNVKEKISELKISISDAQGKVMLQSSLSGKPQEEIDCSNFPAGTYLLRFSSAQGTLVKSIIIGR